MNRKTFLKSTGVGLGLAVVPTIVKGADTASKNELITPLTAKIIRGKDGKILNVLGDVQTYKLNGSDTNNQIVEWIDDLEPGIGIPTHIHTKEDEIFRVIKGEIEVTVDGKSTILREGDIAFAPKNIPHAWRVVGTEKAKMITSAFPAGIEFMFEELASLPAGPPDFEKVAKICGKHGITFVQ